MIHHSEHDFPPVQMAVGQRVQLNVEYDRDCFRITRRWNLAPAEGGVRSSISSLPSIMWHDR